MSFKLQAKVKKINNLVAQISFDEAQSEFEQWFLLSADRHFDSKMNNNRLETKHLNEAKEKNAIIIDCGDLFDAMQGRHDKRRANSALKNEYITDEYLNELINQATKRYENKNMLINFMGNHENGVLKNTGINLTKILCNNINSVQMDYRGYIVIKLTNKKQHTRFYRIYINHGNGGSAKRSKGVLDCDLMAAERPEADLIIQGHNHQNYYVVTGQERLTRNNKIYIKKIKHLRLPSYKDASEMSNGFEVERLGASVLTVGAYWLRLYVDGDRINSQIFEAE